MSYVTGVYVLKRRWQAGYLRKQFVDRHSPTTLPNKLSFHFIAMLLVHAQRISFKDDNDGNTNYDRFIDILMKGPDEQPMVAIVFSVLGDIRDTSSIRDMAMLCVQKGEVDIMTGNALASRSKQLWISEVSRARFVRANTQHLSYTSTSTSTSPVDIIMDVTARYTTQVANKNTLYLMVEKYPTHGDGHRLLDLYGAGYTSSRGTFRHGFGYTVVAEDAAYWYMKRPLVGHT